MPAGLLPAMDLATGKGTPSRDKGVFDFVGGDWTFNAYDEICATAAGIAAEIADLRGSVIGLQLDRASNVLASILAAHLVGAVPLITPHEGAYLAGDFGGSRNRLLSASRAAAILSDGAPDSYGPRFVDIRSVAPMTWSPRSIRHDQAGVLQASSGTEGAPRFFLPTLGQLADNVARIEEWLQIIPGHVAGSWLPLHHDMGLIGCLLPAYVRQNNIYCMRPEEFILNPYAFVSLIANCGMTHTAMPVFALGWLTRKRAALEDVDWHGLESLVIGAEPINASTVDSFARAFAPNGLSRTAIRPGYGLSEATLLVCGAARLAYGAPRGRKLDVCAESEPEGLVTSGSPVGDSTVRIQGEGQELLEDGLIGEIVVGSSCLVRQPCATHEPLKTCNKCSAPPQEWRTGDLGALADGELYVLGRAGDALNISGQLIFADSVERQLNELGIGRCVVALSDDVAKPRCVVLCTGDESAAARRAILAALHRIIPRASTLIEFVAAGDIPRTGSGKPRRREILRLAIQAFNGGESPASAPRPR